MSGRNVLNGAQVIVDYLIQEKVPQVFGLCGHGNVQFIDALYERSDEIKTISVHHESVAGFMADVYYRVSGKPTATFTSCGPGSANLPISLATAYLDSVPFLAVTGNVPTSQFNRGAFQEMYRQNQADFPSTVRSLCKRVFQPTRGEMVPLAVRQAWKTMVTGRPGPVVLDVPFDVFMEASAEEAPDAKAWNGNISSRCGADPDGVVKAVDMLLNAERPVMLVGQAIRHGGAAEELLKLAERLQIPVAASMSGLGVIDTHHPLSLGMVARGGHYQANHATRQADVLLSLGARFDDRTSSSWIPGYSFTIPPTRLIHVDIDPDEIGRNYPVALGLMADVRTFLRQVLAELDRRKDVEKKLDARKKWLGMIDGYRKEWDKLVAPGFTDDTQPINPQRAAAEIQRGLPDDAILVSDIGVHHNWLLGYTKPRRPDSLISCMGFGAMGFGVAGVMGAKFAAPARPCGSGCGDGAGVIWSVQEGAAGGTVAADGLYTAPAAPGTYHVVATAAADPSLTATSVVAVTGTTTLAEETLSPSASDQTVSVPGRIGVTVAGGALSEPVTVTIVEVTGVPAPPPEYTPPALPSIEIT